MAVVRKAETIQVWNANVRAMIRAYIPTSELNFRLLYEGNWLQQACVA